MNTEIERPSFVVSTKNSVFKNLKILIYGPPGNGKTWQCGTLGPRTLLLSAESGHSVLSDKDIKMVVISTDENGAPRSPKEKIEMYSKAYRYALSRECRESIDTIVIDSLSEMSQNILEEKQQEFPDRNQTMVLYGEVAKKSKTMVKAFRDLHGYNVIFTALSEDEKNETGKRFKGISMVGKISQQIAAYFDIVLYLDIYEDESGVLHRRFISASDDSLVVKDRTGKLDRYEPADLGALIRKVNGVK